MFVCAMFCACTSKTAETEVEAIDTTVVENVNVDTTINADTTVVDTLK